MAEAANYNRPQVEPADEIRARIGQTRAALSAKLAALKGRVFGIGSSNQGDVSRMATTKKAKAAKKGGAKKASAAKKKGGAKKASASKKKASAKKRAGSTARRASATTQLKRKAKKALEGALAGAATGAVSGAVNAIAPRR